MTGKINISRINGGAKGYIEIEVEDDSSHQKFIEIRMTMENLALALTGMGMLPCEFSLKKVERVGLRREVKRVDIEISSTHCPISKEQEEEYLSPHEKNGWKAYVESLHNNHNNLHSPSPGYTKRKVMFERYVDKTTGKPLKE